MENFKQNPEALPASLPISLSLRYDELGSFINEKRNRRGRIRNVRDCKYAKCEICGDKPTGYHYDVLSCNGCKTFFRRTIALKRIYFCSRSGNCPFTKDFRCSCRACRFSKCVAAGMNPDGIQFLVQIDCRKEKTREEEKKCTASLTQLPIETFREMIIMRDILQRELTIESYRMDDSFCCEYRDIPLEELMKRQFINRTLEIKKEVPEPCDTFLNDKMSFWAVGDLFLTVEFAKTFPEFQLLGIKNQYEILYNMGGTIRILSQAYYSLEHHSESVIFPDGTDALYEQVVQRKKTEYEGYYRDCYCRPVHIIRQLELTKLEFAIFKAIVLFTVDGELDKLGQRVVINKREELLKIFRKHLVEEYGTRAGLEKLAICVATIKTFMDINEKRRSRIFVVDLMKQVPVPKLVKGIYLKK